MSENTPLLREKDAKKQLKSNVHTLYPHDSTEMFVYCDPEKNVECSKGKHCFLNGGKCVLTMNAAATYKTINGDCVIRSKDMKGHLERYKHYKEKEKKELEKAGKNK